MVHFFESRRQENSALKTAAGLDKPDNGVIDGRKVHKFGLKLRIKMTKVETHIWPQKFLETCKKYLFI